MIQISIELSRPPSPDEYGDWGFRTGVAHYEDGWFTYAIDTDDPMFFEETVGDGWHEWMKKETRA